MEYFDLYTFDRKPLGKKVQRGAPIPFGEYHIVVQVMTINNKGEILLTQRVPEKTSGGKWECSGGCAVSGETSREAAVRELFEETGIEVSPDELKLDWTMTTDSMLRDFYIVMKDVPLSQLRLQAIEVSERTNYQNRFALAQCARQRSVFRRCTGYASGRAKWKIKLYRR